MKKRNLITLFAILFFIFLLIPICLSLIYNKQMFSKNDIKLIKSLTESTQISNFETQINELNKSHNDFTTYLQSYKTKIAEAITSQGVETSSDSTAEIMADNIGKILATKTQASATADDIAKGKTAWVNGEYIVGSADNYQDVSHALYQGTTKTIEFTTTTNAYWDSSWGGAGTRSNSNSMTHEIPIYYFEEDGVTYKALLNTIQVTYSVKGSCGANSAYKASGNWSVISTESSIEIDSGSSSSKSINMFGVGDLGSDQSLTLSGDVTASAIRHNTVQDAVNITTTINMLLTYIVLE